MATEIIEEKAKLWLNSTNATELRRKEKALETSPVKPKWWRRYVDDSNACIKKDSVEVFHNHLNSINANIQFAVEMPTTTMGKNSIAFLDTNNTVNEDGKIEVGVHRKATHTSKYLDSIHTALHKARELSLRV